MKHTIFFLKNKIFRNFATEYYKEALSNQYLSANQLKEINFKKKKRIVDYAYKNSKFYRSHFEAHSFHPDDLKIESDWNKVPILTRKDIIDNFDDILVKKYLKQGRISTTGGSSGVPLKVYHDLRFPSEILGWRMLDWWGTSFGANFASIYRSQTKSFINKLMWYPTRKANLDASSMSFKDMENFTRILQRIKPEIIQGYVGSVEYYAKFVLENNIKIPSPKICWTTSAPITKVQKNTIESAFHSRVMDQYGCCEIFWLAQECPKQEGLHINYDYRDISVLDENNQCINDTGNPGKLAITDFENFLFPLIKYINGDEGSYNLTRCSCGVSLPLLNPIKGRTTDCIILPNKTIIGGDYLTTIFDHIPDSVLGFQVRQLKDGSIIILYIPNGNFKGNIEYEIAKIKSTLLEKTLKSVNIEFQIVEEIKHDRGKNRYVINEMLK